MMIKSKNMLILLFLFLWTPDSWALWPFKYNWVKIKSENFVVLTSKTHENYGLLVSKKAEEAFDSLQVLSDQHPRTTYIIVDHTKNFSNGSATLFPYPLIKIQPNTPSPYQSIGQYDDWLYELLVHEYTHILSFHNVGGFYRPLRWLFGSTISPGYFMPLWYLEGLAVNTESFLSKGGRLRSSRYQSFLDHLYETNISYANEQQTGQYPYGSAPYIYGSWINHYAATNSKKHDDPIKALESLHKTFSQRVPYLINSGFHASHKVGAYKSFQNTFVKNRPKSVDQKPNLGEFPQWSEHHKALFYLRENEFSRDRIYKLKNKKENLVINFLEIAFFRVTKDFIYFVTSDIEKQDHQVFNLRSYNFKTKKIKKLSKGLNIHNFDILGDKIVFIKKNIDKQQLVTSKLSHLKETQKVLFTIKGQERLALPTFINSRTVVFAYKKPNQKEELIEINLKKMTRRILEKKAHINFIEAFKNKVYFTFEENGAKYLNRADLNRELSVPQGLLTFDIRSTNEVYTSTVGPDGPEVLKVSLKDLKTTAKIVKLANYKKANNQDRESPNIENYSSFTKLAPHYVIPNFIVSPYGFSGDLRFGLSIGSQDPLAMNSYTISTFTDTITKRVSTSFDYTSSHFRTPLNFSVNRINTPLSLKYTRTSTNAGFATSYTFNSNIGQSFRIGGGFLWSKVTNNHDDQGELLRGDNIPLIYLWWNNHDNQGELLGGPFLSFDLQNTQFQTRELAPRKGYRLRLSAQYFAPLKEDYFDYLNIRFGTRNFFKSPLVSSHRLIFGLDGQWNNKRLPVILTSNSLNQLYRGASMGDFTLRGAPTGAFLAADWFTSAHLEYRFPIVDINWGPGLLPAFLNRMTGAITSDYAVMEGADLINRRFVDESTKLYSAGVELVLEGKAFYHLPASLQIGLYKFLNQEVYDGDPELFVGFNLPGF